MSPDLHELESRTLGEHAAEILPDLDVLAEQLRADTGEALPKLEDGESTPDLERERAELLAFARRAVEALRQTRGMEVRLMPEEEVGVQALLAFTSRPVILVQGGRFAVPPPLWADLDTVYRSGIETVLRSVGRVELSGHPALSWAGTAWVVAPGLVMTSRSVAGHIAGGVTARIDFGRELDAPSDESRIFDVREDEPILVHPEHDLALVRVVGDLPPALALAADGVREGRKVYVAGHPARDERAPERLLQYRLFQGIFGVKRLQPGQVMQTLPETGTFLHDCSTLGAHSGSPVIDLETNRVAGLHCAGAHRHASLAVALWTLADDLLLREAGIRFAE